MELLAGILCFLNIVSTFYTIKDKIRSKDQREVVSQFLHKVGRLLLEVADDLEQGLYPHNKCSIMYEYMTNLNSVLSGQLTEQQIEYLHTKIVEAYQVEKLLGDLNRLNSMDKKGNISLLREIAGSYSALGDLIKLG